MSADSASSQLPASIDEQLGLIAGGDQQAFTLLYDGVARRVFGLVRRIVVDPSQAEEVTQEVFLEVWRRAGEFEPARGSGEGWILRLAHSRAVDRVRASQASRDRDLRVGVRDQELDFDWVAEAGQIRVESDAVKAALRGLPGKQREAIELAFLGGFTHQEIAVGLQVPVGTIKTRIRDGMIQLRRFLTETTPVGAPVHDDDRSAAAAAPTLAVSYH